MSDSKRVIELDDEDGWFLAKVKGRDGQAHEIRLDALKANLSFAAIAEEYVTELERGEAWAKYLTEHGVPPVSDAVALKIAHACIDMCRVMFPAPQEAQPSTPAATE